MATSGVTTTGATTGTTGTSTTSLTSKAGTKSALDNLDFTTYITLLTVQLKNQDPMKPMDSQQFTSEIATYAQLEQQIKGNDLLEKVADAKDYSMQAVATSYIGKQVLAEDTGIAFDGTKAVDFAYNIKKAGAVSAEMSIFNDKGVLVKTVKVNTDEGLHAVTWDGTLDDGTKAAAGNYSLQVSAKDKDGKVVSSAPLTYRTAKELISEDGELYVKTDNGNVVKFTDIKSVRGAA